MKYRKEDERQFSPSVPLKNYDGPDTEELENMPDDQFLHYLYETYGQSRKKSVRGASTISNLKADSRLMRSCDMLHSNIRRTVDFDYRKTSPIPQLREKEQQRCFRQTITNRKLNDPNKLKESLAINDNVFQQGPLPDFATMEVQHTLWQKNFRLKSAINDLQSENNTLRAHTWNISKDNRKMKRQIDSWNLEKSMLFSGDNRKPYIDSTTMKKVYQDQDFSVVSMKLQLADQQEKLNEKQNEIDQRQSRIDKIEQEVDFLNQNLYEVGCDLFQQIMQQVSASKLQQMARQMQEKLKEQTERLYSLERQLQHSKNQRAHLTEQFQTMQKPVRRLSPEAFEQMKKSVVMQQQQQEQPAKILQEEIDRQSNKIKELEMTIQKKTNDSVLVKQELRRRIRALQARLRATEPTTQPQ